MKKTITLAIHCYGPAVLSVLAALGCLAVGLLGLGLLVAGVFRPSAVLLLVGLGLVGLAVWADRRRPRLG